MIQVKIIRDSQVTHLGQFESQELADAWLTKHESKGTFGQKAGPVETQVETSPAVLDEQGSVISPAQFETVITQVDGYSVQIQDITAELQAKVLHEAKIQAGKAAREACQKVLDYIAGENLDRELTVPQITALQSMFANAEAALRAGRPSFAKQFIAAITPDEVLVTSEMKSAALALLEGY